MKYPPKILGYMIFVRSSGEWLYPALHILQTPNQSAIVCFISPFAKSIPHSKQKNFSCISSLYDLFTRSIVNLFDTRLVLFRKDNFNTGKRINLRKNVFSFLIEGQCVNSLMVALMHGLIMPLRDFQGIKPVHHGDGGEGGPE
ncbi:MAG TPA: hypothetical protein VH415_13225 [Nitrososphaeraceae archaeon]